ncbi:hypothetical protein ANTQUA_LOCUS5705 [Anthophora quadrimaculata]
MLVSVMADSTKTFSATSNKTIGNRKETKNKKVSENASYTRSKNTIFYRKKCVKLTLGKNTIFFQSHLNFASKGLRTEVGSETRRQSEEKASGVILQENVT